MTIYVDSNAAGANDGTSWTDAYTTLQAADSVASAGELVLVEYRHTEGASGSFTIDFSSATTTSPVRCVSVDKDNSDAYRRGGTVNTTSGNLSLRGQAIFEGLDLEATASTGDIFLYDDPHFYDCNFNCGDNLSFAGSDSHFTLVGCTIDAEEFVTVFRMNIRFVGCTINLTKTSGSHWQSVSTNSVVSFESCDFSGCNAGQTSLFSGWLVNTHFTFRDCRLSTAGLPTDAVVSDGMPTCLIERCEVGTVSGEVEGLSKLHVAGSGTVESNTTVVRTGGAADGSNSYSWKMTGASTLTGTPFRALATPPIALHVDSGASSLTVYLAGDASLNDDDVWIEVQSPNEGATIYSLARFQSTYDYAGASLTTDSGSTWSGSPAAEYKIDFSIDPDLSGPAFVRVFLAKASATVYVDPQIGGNKHYMAAGVQASEASGGGTKYPRSRIVNA